MDEFCLARSSEKEKPIPQAQIVFRTPNDASNKEQKKGFMILFHLPTHLS